MTSRCTNLLSLRKVWFNFHKWLLKEIGLQKKIYVANNSSDELLMTLSAFASHYQTVPNTKINISLPQTRFFLLLKIKPRRIKQRGRVDEGSTYLIRPRLVAWFSLGPSLILIWPTLSPFRPLGTKASAYFHDCFNSSRKSFERWKKLHIFSPVVLSCVPVTLLAKLASSQTKCFPNLYSMPLKIF